MPLPLQVHQRSVVLLKLKAGGWPFRTSVVAQNPVRKGAKWGSLTLSCHLDFSWLHSPHLVLHPPYSMEGSKIFFSTRALCYACEASQSLSWGRNKLINTSNSLDKWKWWSTTKKIIWAYLDSSTWNCMHDPKR